MRDHHKRALENARVRLLAENPDLLAILLGGSIAKGNERDDSDVDLMVVLPDARYHQQWSESRIRFGVSDLCDYPGGYVEGRFVSRSFIQEAAERGSEPTRHSFTGVYTVYCVDPDIAGWLPLIPVYPEDQRKEKIAAFLAQMQVSRWFWNEGRCRNDRYLLTRAATDMVLFGCRLILAHNRQLFACQKRLMEQTLATVNQPQGLKDKIERLLTEMSDDAMVDFCQTVESFADWNKTEDPFGRFMQDVEMSWFHRVHAVSEW